MIKCGGKKRGKGEEKQFVLYIHTNCFLHCYDPCKERLKIYENLHPVHCSLYVLLQVPLCYSRVYIYIYMTVFSSSVKGSSRGCKGEVNGRGSGFGVLSNFYFSTFCELFILTEVSRL